MGRAGSELVTKNYARDRPGAFADGVIKQVIVDVNGGPFVNVEHEAQASWV